MSTTHFKYICRTCKRKAIFDDEERALRWWLKHDGHDRSAKIIRDTPPERPRPSAMSTGPLAYCPRCRTGEHLPNFDEDYDAWSLKHRRCA